jgi:hypothetical protein
MNRTFVLLITLTLAATAGAAEPAQKTDPSASPQSGSGMHKDSAPASRPPTKTKPKQLSKKDQQILDTKNAKAAFMSAVGSCTRPDMCDPKSPNRNRDMVQLITETEQRFMDACQACAKPQVCEAEREKIRSGSGRFGSNPCK